MISKTCDLVDETSIQWHSDAFGSVSDLDSRPTDGMDSLRPLGIYCRFI